jgi:hypothetical protein
MRYNDNLSRLDERVFFDDLPFFRFCHAPQRDWDVFVCASSCLFLCDPSFFCYIVWCEKHLYSLNCHPRCVIPNGDIFLGTGRNPHPVCEELQ